MKSTFSFDYDILQHNKQLDSTEKELLRVADEQMLQAYAPYSKFFVGAAVLLDNGKIIAGSNQENASYPLCMCAERVALYTAISQYPEAKALKMAIVAKNPNQKVNKPIPPCGACRQVILEFENRFDGPISILLRDDFGKYYRFESAKQLLPLAFDGSFLLKD